jgi:hypothetical protein
MTHASTAPVVPQTAIATEPRTHSVHRSARARPMLLGVFGVFGTAALAVAAVLTLGGGHSGNSAAPGTPVVSHSPAAARSVAPTTSPAGPKKAAAPAATPSASPKRPYAVDSCLVGNWKDAGDVLDNTIDGQTGQFTGTGGGMEVTADGSGTEQFGPETLTATIAGNVWTEVLGGSATMHVTTRDGDMVFSDVAASPDASYKLYENGIYNNSGPMSVSTTPTRYTCSSSTLRLYWSDGSSTYRRES